MSGQPPLILDGPSFVKSPYSWAAGMLTVDGLAVRTDGSGRGWLRRYAPSLWGAGSVIGSLESVRKRAFLSLVGSVSRVGARSWLTALPDMLQAEDRLLQLDTVARCGHRVPRTVVTSNVDVAREALGERFVVKPLSSGYYNAEEGPRAVFATVLSAEDFDRVDFADAPFVCQEMLVAAEHLRVVTVGSKVWAARLHADGRPLDWRQQDEAHVSWLVADDPDVCRAALDVARALNVGYTSQDWIRDKNDCLTFLDLNPGGQWLFLPDPVAASVTRRSHHSWSEPDEDSESISTESDLDARFEVLPKDAIY